jgi:hypothetical protein
MISGDPVRARAPLVLNGALSQDDRLATAPAPEAFDIDGRSLAELLAFGARYGTLIRFYDLADMPHGDWSVFFARDPAVAAAVRGALDLPEIEAGLRQLLAQARAAAAEDQHHHHIDRAHKVVFRLLVIIDDSDAGEESDFDLYLGEIAQDRRDRLAGPLASLHRHRQQRSNSRPWRHRDLDLLEDLVAALLAELEHSAAVALATVDAELQSRGHAPQAAVWNAFVQLYAQARTTLNQFPRRLLEFYYADVLRQSHRAAVPARAWLTFTLNKDAASASVPKGTGFVAGTDRNGDPIVYAADRSLLVTPATVVGIGVHRVARGRDDDRTGVLSGVVTLGGDGPVPGPIAAFPAFGTDRRGTIGALTMTPASLGFVVSSPVLMLTGGIRDVAITLASSPKAVRHDAEAAHSAMAPKRTLTAMAVASPTPAAATSLAAGAPTGLWFVLYYSTAGGWVQVEDVHFTTSLHSAHGEEVLDFRFSLSAGAPPLVALSTKPAPGAAPPDLPANSFPVAHDAPTVVAQLLDHPAGPPGSPTAGAPVSRLDYQVLDSIKVATVTIAVTVDGLPPAQLASSGGAIDPAQDFALFGLAPAPLSSLTITAPELFIKVPSRLALTIDWAGRPLTSTGFAGWYKDYVVDGDGQVSATPLFDNSSFRAGFALRQPGLWQVSDPAPLYLFQTTGSSTAASGLGPAPAAPVAARSLLAVPGIARSRTPPTYLDTTTNALMLTLSDPAWGFGDTLYARNLMAASSANAAAMQQSPATASADQLAAARAANAGAAPGEYVESVGTAVGSAIAAFNADALAALHAAIPASGVPPEHQQSWREALSGAITDLSVAGSWWHRLWHRTPRIDDAGITARLQGWVADYRQRLGGASNPALQTGESLLARAEKLASNWHQAAAQPVAAARPQLATALQPDAAAVVTPALALVLPNPPWLPKAAAIGIAYAAHDSQPAPAAPAEALAAPATTSAASATGTAAAPVGTVTPAPFAHLDLFEQIVTAGTVPSPHLAPEARLLPPVAGEAALYIDLSAPVDAISLLFVLEAGPDGWTDGASQIIWEKQIGNQWWPVTLLQDGTDGLCASGIVELQVGTSQHDHRDTASRLRALLAHGSSNSAYITSVTANAVTVTWTGTAGATELGLPLPAGSITQAQAAIPDIAAITQPVPGFGGVPPATGREFDMWMAEQLRHKGRAIAADDYARLVLAAIPTLWQLAVVPATDAATGQPAPGRLWLVAVAGPQTPNITDTTIPAVDPATLALIGETMASLASPFLKVTVTNPPWVRIKVKASLVFSDADTPAAWIDRLQAELVRWLSPWPDAQQPGRPREYWTRRSIAEFVRQRPYVKGVERLTLHYDRDPATGGWHYFTSALHHRLEQFTPPAEPAHRHGMAPAS